MAGPSLTACSSARRTTSGSRRAEQRVEVAVSGGGEEGIDECGLAEPVCLPGRVLLLHARAGAACELAGRWRAAVEDRGDLVEGDREDVVQDERDSLGRSAGVEYDQQREPDRVGKECLVFGSDSPGFASGSGRARPAGGWGRDLRAWSMFKQTRETTVVS